MRDKLFIDGRWLEPVSGGTFEVVNPATEELVHRAPLATAADIDRAVEAARRAFDDRSWSGLSGHERATHLRAIADGIRTRLGLLSKLEVIDNGKPYPEAEWDISDAADCFDYYAGLAEQLDRRPAESIENVAKLDPRRHSRRHLTRVATTETATHQDAEDSDHEKSE